MTSGREDLRVEDLGLLSEAEGLANRYSIYKPKTKGWELQCGERKKFRTVGFRR